jgi:hypothetical protein
MIVRHQRHVRSPHEIEHSQRIRLINRENTGFSRFAHFRQHRLRIGQSRFQELMDAFVGRVGENRRFAIFHKITKIKHSPPLPHPLHRRAEHAPPTYPRRFAANSKAYDLGRGGSSNAGERRPQRFRRGHRTNQGCAA